jgi:predicted transcriptional regulator of viral defense system
VSDIERTLLDGLARPDLCGGIKEVVRGIWSMQKQIDWEKLIDYAKKYHIKAAIKRLGFILEMLALGGAYINSLEKIISDKKDYVLLDPDGLKSGPYLRRWRLRINMNTDELKAGVWG